MTRALIRLGCMLLYLPAAAFACFVAVASLGTAECAIAWRIMEIAEDGL